MRGAPLLAALALAGGLAACASRGAPLFRATEEGRIFVRDPLTGVRIERALERFGPLVRELLGASGEAEPPDVYFLRSTGLDYGLTAATLPDRILLGAADRSDLEYSIAHELAHWYMPSSAFGVLPLFAQEGLAVYVGLSFFDPFLDNLGRGNRWETSPPSPSHLYLDHIGWYQLEPDERRELSELALEVVYRIGLERLRAMCGEGSPSIPALLEEAGLYAPPGSARAGDKRAP